MLVAGPRAVTTAVNAAGSSVGPAATTRVGGP